MGKGQLRTEGKSFSVKDLTAALDSEALGWDPEIFTYSAGASPCRIAIRESDKLFDSNVRWTSFPGIDGPYQWRGTGGDVVAVVLSDGLLELIFPCKIPGAHKQQEKDRPLGVRVWGDGMPKFDTGLRWKMIVALARNLDRELGCVNKPDIPSDFTAA